MNKLMVLDDYPVYIGKQILSGIQELVDVSKFSQIVVVTDEIVSKHYFDLIKKSLPNVKEVIISFGERQKNIETVKKIWEEFLKIGVDRKSLILNLGGGVIGDTGGFAASTYMRGVRFVQIPTTLLAQVDASIGGKVGINFGGVKNLIGVFNQPSAVICDVSTLKSLGDREFIEGFGEVIKHGIIADKKYFDFVTSKKPREFSEDDLVKIVTGSCEIKNKIVSEDVTEKDIRRMVNFGHTIGHALESLSLETGNYLLHGESVSLGMVAEGKISELKGLISKQDLETIIKVLEDACLPTKIEIPDQKKVLKKIQSDKKSEGGVVYWTLVTEIGKCATGQVVEDELIKKALEFIKA